MAVFPWQNYNTNENMTVTLLTHYQLTFSRLWFAFFFFSNQSTTYNRDECQILTFQHPHNSGLPVFSSPKGRSADKWVEVKWKRGFSLLHPTFAPGWGRIQCVELWQPSYLQEGKAERRNEGKWVQASSENFELLNWTSYLWIFCRWDLLTILQYWYHFS